MSEGDCTLVTVYGLSSSRDPAIRYVGQTILKLPARRTLWRNNAQLKTGCNSKVCRWIRDLYESGADLVITALEEDAERHVRERYWIAKLRADGAPLLNVAEGGAGCPGVIPNDDTRRKRAESVRKSWETETVRVRFRATEEQLKKMSDALRVNHPRSWLGRKHTDETKAKMSASAKARWAARKKE